MALVKNGEEDFIQEGFNSVGGLAVGQRDQAQLQMQPRQMEI